MLNLLNQKLVEEVEKLKDNIISEQSKNLLAIPENENETPQKKQ